MAIVGVPVGCAADDGYYNEDRGRPEATKLKGEFGDAVGNPASAGSMRDIVYRLRHMLALMWLTILQYGAVGPSLVYISTTFFAGPGSDCEADPKSDVCKRGAAELAYWKGIISGISQSVAWLLALTLGSFSDSVGRRPVFRAKAVVSLMPIAALAAHEFLGTTLWAYMFIDMAYSIFDANGVFLAYMSDVITEPGQRSQAYAVIAMAFVLGGSPVLLCALLSSKTAIMISAAASAAKLAFVWTAFPETLMPAKGGQRRPFSLTDTALEALGVFSRHSFISRMAAILVLSGLSMAGLGVVTTPILTGYLGMEKRESTILALSAGASAFIAMAIALKPLTRRYGDVGALRICLAVAAVFPLLFAACGEVWHVAVLDFFMFGPLLLQFPIISAIKTNLVGDDEQGLVQGALAAIRVVAVAVSDVFFGWCYRTATDDGAAPRPATVPPLLMVSGLAAVALAISCTLADEPPPPPRSPCEDEVRAARSASQDEVGPL